MSGKVQTKLNTTNVNNNFKKEKSRGLQPSTLKQPIELIFSLTTTEQEPRWRGKRPSGGPGSSGGRPLI